MAIKPTSFQKHLIIITLMGLFISMPFFRPGLPKTDDGISMVIRASGFHQSFKDGHFPVRWIQRLNENYGYPVTNFLYPLPFYVAEIPNLLGFSALASVKLTFVFFTLLSGFSFYLWARLLCKSPPALIATTLYLFSPYRFILLYQRGSLGETAAMAIIPLVLWQLEHYLKSKHPKHLLFSAIFLGLTITAHNSLALIFTPIILAYFGIKSFTQKNQPRQIISSLAILALLSLGLSCFFWLPALHDLQFTRAPQIQISNIQEHFQNPLDLTAALGFTALTIVWAAMGFLHRRTVHFWIIIFSLAIAIQIPFALPLWQVAGLDRLIQFPLRFLSVAVLSSSALAACLFSYFKSLKNQKYFKYGLIGFILLTFISTPFFFTTPIEKFPPGFFEANFDTSTNQKEFTPIWVKEDPKTYAQSFYQINSLGDQPQVIDQSTKANYQYLQIKSGNSYQITFNTHYFPGWQPYVQDNPVDYTIDPQGRIQIQVQPQGQQIKSITLRFQETPLRQFANTITLVSIIGIVAYLISTSKNKKKYLGLISIILITVNLGYTLLIKQNELLVKFDPIVAEQKYINSQWVNPKSDAPIGDHGLYQWAGWAYFQGENPILINSEMPPLGKYLIGLGLLITGRPGIIGLVSTLTAAASLYFLSKQIITDKYLSLIPVALLSFEKIFRGLLTITMLDSIQLAFLAAAFYFLARPKLQTKHFILANLMIGGVISTKFYATGILVIAACILFFLLSKQIHHLKKFVLTLPFVALVHLLSYTQYFLLGNSLLDYLGVQKYIYTFYSQGGPRVPFGAYWLLVLFNRWRVWWGANWGQYYTISSKEWNPLWPIGLFTALFSVFGLFNHAITQWNSKKPKPQPYHLLTSWLLVYGTFLTFIGGWPHYMLLFLPFAYILLIKYLIKYNPHISNKLHQLTQLTHFVLLNLFQHRQLQK